jgi:hypothetical protein
MPDSNEPSAQHFYASKQQECRGCNCPVHSDAFQGVHFIETSHLEARSVVYLVHAVNPNLEQRLFFRSGRPPELPDRLRGTDSEAGFGQVVLSDAPARLMY